MVPDWQPQPTEIVKWVEDATLQHNHIRCIYVSGASPARNPTMRTTIQFRESLILSTAASDIYQNLDGVSLDSRLDAYIEGGGGDGKRAFRKGWLGVPQAGGGGFMILAGNAFQTTFIVGGKITIVQSVAVQALNPVDAERFLWTFFFEPTL